MQTKAKDKTGLKSKVITFRLKASRDQDIIDYLDGLTEERDGSYFIREAIRAYMLSGNKQPNVYMQRLFDTPPVESYSSGGKCNKDGAMTLTEAENSNGIDMEQKLNSLIEFL